MCACSAFISRTGSCYTPCIAVPSLARSWSLNEPRKRPRFQITSTCLLMLPAYGPYDGLSISRVGPSRRLGKQSALTQLHHSNRRCSEKGVYAYWVRLLFVPLWNNTSRCFHVRVKDTKLLECRFLKRLYVTLSYFNPNASKIVAVGLQRYSINQPSPLPGYRRILCKTISPSRSKEYFAAFTINSAGLKPSSSEFSPAIFGTWRSIFGANPPTSADGPDSI